ncbi:MAG: hypothetical protein AB7G21_09860 [Dehalococcoidia bacterium]
MSGCPVHIWAPLMAAALPFSRAIRDRVRAQFSRPAAPLDAPPRELHRWAPVGQTQSAASEETAPRS